MRVLFRTLILFFIASLTPAFPAAAEPLPRSVLIVSQWDAGLPYFTALSNAFHTTLQATSAKPISIYSEALDLSRFPTPKHQENFRRYLREKYRDKDLGAIVVVGALALEFMLRVRAEVSPTTPLIFSQVDEATIAKLSLPPDVTGTMIRLTLRDMVVIARVLEPRLQRIALVGEPLQDTSIYRNFKDELSNFSKLEFIDLTGLPFAEIKNRVTALPENTIILYTAIFVDGEGVAYDPTLALESIANVANRPIVHRTETQLGHGAVGGLIVKPSLVGNDAARLTLRILSGESAANIPIVLGNYNKPIFDWRQLARWGISESQLPPDSEIRFRVPGIWEQYRWYVIIAFAIMAFQLVLIVWLLIEHRRRLSAEVDLRHRLMEIAHLNRSAITGALSTSIAHELNQPLGAILSSAEAAEIYLNADPPNLERVKMILGNIRRDDQRAADIVSHLRGLLKKKSDADLQNIGLEDAIKEILYIIVPDAIKRDVVLNTNFVQGIRSVRANKIQLQQVILNLAVNGMDAMQDCAPGARKLSIETVLVDESKVEVSVSDSGTGIPLDKLNKVFDTFYTTKKDGTGLGLSISRTIIENYGGKMWAENKSLGGAVFRFTLPLLNNPTA